MCSNKGFSLIFSIKLHRFIVTSEFQIKTQSNSSPFIPVLSLLKAAVISNSGFKEEIPALFSPKNGEKRPE